MTERKDTNPFNTEGSTPPHLPASVYQPNPFPLNPAEGNPWAGTTNEQPYQSPPQQGHVNAYDNTSSSYGRSYNTSDQSNYSTYTMQMPTPSVNYNINNSSPYGYSNSAYNQNAYAPTYDTNAYSTNAYNPNNPNPNEYSNTNVNHGVDASEHDGHVKSEREDSYDENTTELDGSVTAANPGIETHDPDKLNISNGTIKASLNGTPNKWRLLSRFIQFIASVGALAFIIGAPVASHVSTPGTANNTAIIFLHIVSIVSIIYSFSHLVFYCLRRWRHKNKAPRWSLLLVDIVLGVSFGTLMVFLIKDFRCSPGKLNGWCDFYNTAIFFTVLAFFTYAVSFIWDLVGGFKSIRS